MDAKILIKNSQGSEISISIGFEVLASMVNCLPDEKSMVELYEFLSEHDAAEVRDAVASREHLSEATLVRLLADPSSRVKASLVSSESFREWVTTEALIEMCRSDSNLARDVASSVGSFANADTDALVKELTVHPDPAVRMDLASAWGVSKFSIKALAKDPDPSVASAALRELENR